MVVIYMIDTLQEMARSSKEFEVAANKILNNNELIQNEDKGLSYVKLK